MQQNAALSRISSLDRNDTHTCSDTMTTLLFIDETTSEPVQSGRRLVALTGVAISVEKYGIVRTQFYNKFRQQRTEGGLTVNLSPLELHGRKLLPGATDDERIAALNEVANLVLEHDLGIYRFGYLTSDSLVKFFGDKDIAYLLSWADLVGSLQSELKNGPLIPIADSGNPRLADHMSRFIKNIDVMREGGLGHSLSVQGTENIIGEVFFGESKYSVFVQMADICSYLLLKRDMQKLGWQVSEFNQRVLEVAERLLPVLRDGRIADAQMQGSVMSFAEL